jgi:hypothetical protein
MPPLREAGGPSVAQSHICEKCGFYGKPRKHTDGSCLVELILWLLGGIPGALYTVWRLTTRRSCCPICKGAMIPAALPRGQQLLRHYRPDLF